MQHHIYVLGRRMNGSFAKLYLSNAHLMISNSRNAGQNHAYPRTHSKMHPYRPSAVQRGFQWKLARCPPRRLRSTTPAPNVRPKTQSSTKQFSRGENSKLVEKLNETMTLSDGRKLGYTDIGVRGAYPIFWFHGWPSCRLSLVGSVSHAEAVNVRIISIDRPGLGLSDSQPNRRIIDFPNDVRELAQHLGLRKYKILAVSGGCPYGLACAKFLPRSECSAIGIMAGMAPWTFETAQYMNPTMRIWANLTAWSYVFALYRAGRRAIKDRIRHVAERDRCKARLERLNSCNDDTLREEIRYQQCKLDYTEFELESHNEIFKQGIQGVARDRYIVVLPWGFDLRRIRRKILFWYGEDDINTPMQMGEYMREQIGHGSVLKSYPGETHWTINKNHIREILRELLRSQG